MSSGFRLRCRTKINIYHLKICSIVYLVICVVLKGCHLIEWLHLYSSRFPTSVAVLSVNMFIWINPVSYTKLWNLFPFERKYLNLFLVLHWWITVRFASLDSLVLIFFNFVQTKITAIFTCMFWVCLFIPYWNLG